MEHLTHQENHMHEYFYSFSNHDSYRQILSDLTICEVEIPIQVSADLHYFFSDWGDEFAPRQTIIEHEFTLKAMHGRSSKQNNPFFYIKDGETFHAFHIAYSGNYQVIFQFIEDILYISLHFEDGFETQVAPSETFESFHVYVTLDNTSLDEISHHFTTFVRNNIFSPTCVERFPVVWNHWWTYEDIAINQEIFKQNVMEAKKLGFEVAMLDAGWFGEEDAFWELIRGDWYIHNKNRFPDGIRALSDFTHAQGLKFGIWIELEGLGIHSKIYEEQPQLVATRDGESLHYICLASTYAQKWAIDTLTRLIVEYQADYIKIDFNLDPMQGCNCLEHDHGLHDGLFKHYQGLYHVLATIKNKYPNVILENCSSGGLRSDLGLLKYFDTTFLSDPDFSETTHQCFYGHHLYLPSEHIFHFSWSHAIDKGRYAIPHMDLENPNHSEANKRFFMRSVMTHSFGMSHPLIDLSQTNKDIIKQEIDYYKNNLRPFYLHSYVNCNPKQTIRHMYGERNPYVIHLNHEQTKGYLFVFGLELALPSTNVHIPFALTKRYQLRDIDTNEILLLENTDTLLIKGICPYSAKIFEIEVV